jgi:hypothetical protein
MKHIITFILAFLLAATAIVVKAQVAEVVSAGGEKLSATNISIEFTVGEPAVAVWSQSAIQLFEGLQAANYSMSLVTGVFSETALAFYPNPALKFLNVDGDFTFGSTFNVTDVSGKNFELPTELGAHRAVVDVSMLPPSLYVLTIQDPTGLLYRVKFIKAL